MFKNDSKLAWLDCEMTGLSIDSDYILEIAVIMTDLQLRQICSIGELVINHPHDILDKMNSWCRKQHTKNKLIESVQKSTFNIQEVEHLILNMLRQHSARRNVYLCGSSVWNDRRFLAKYMPKLEKYFHYRIIDLATMRMFFALKGYPINPKSISSNHRAMDDVKDNIVEFKRYLDINMV